MSKTAGGFDPILKISELEGQLTKAHDRIRELEYMLDKLNDVKSAGSGGRPSVSSSPDAQIKSLIDENVKLKSELSKLNQTKGKTDKLLFSMSREHASASQRMAKRSATNITLKRLNYRAQEVQILQEEVVRWLNGLLTAPVLAQPLTRDTMMDVLSTGSVLCALMKRIKPALAAPAIMGKVHEKATPGSFFAHDNVKAFFNGCLALGVPQRDLFETNDLVGNNKNTRAVVHCILSLAKEAVKEGIPPPEIVRIDLELDEAKAQQANEGKSKPAAAAADAAKEKEKEAAQAKEEAAVAKAIVELCKQFNVPPAKKLKGTLYQFSDAAQTAAYVRMLRGTPLIRLKEGWEELSTFLEKVAQASGQDSAEETAIKKRIEDAMTPLKGQLSNMMAHRDALAAQLTEVQTQLSVIHSDASKAQGRDSVSSKEAEVAARVEMDARVKTEVATATAELKEQLLRAIDERDKVKHTLGPELSQLKMSLSSVQAERDELTGKLIDAQSKLAPPSSATLSEAEKNASAAKSLADVKGQLLGVMKERDAISIDKSDLLAKLKSAEAKLIALQDELSKAESSSDSKTKKSGGSVSGKKSVGFAGAGGVDEESDEEAEEKRKARADEEAYKEFFFLTALAVKMNHNALGDAVELIATASTNSADLFEKARAHDVPFHQFHKWIEKELTMAYLLASHNARAELGATHHKDLRSLRAQRQTVIKNRPHASPVIADSSQG